MLQYYPVLSIAGSDSSGGAGIQADIKTISAIGCYAMTAITAITVQNTMGVDGVQPVEPHIVAGQIEAVYADIEPLAVKTGMLYDNDCVRAVADALEKHPCPNLVIDPVMVSTSGSPLIEQRAVEAIVNLLFPMAAIVTPNRNEAYWLTGEQEPGRQAAAFHAMGCRNVLLKGGDSADELKKTDYLSIAGTALIELSADAISTPNTHGTGCTLSSAIASYLALGYPLKRAVAMAKRFVTEGLRAGADVSCGHGHGPLNHFFSPRRLKTYHLPDTRINN